MVFALLATFLFSVSAVCAGHTARVLGGTEANFCRLVVAALCLGVWAHVFGQGLQGHALGWFLMSGCIGFGVGDLALFQALPRLGARLSLMMIQCFAAPVGAFVEWLWLGTALTIWQMVCGATILMGVALALKPDRYRHLSRRELILGTIAGILAAAGQGIGAVLSRKAYEVAEQTQGMMDGPTAAYQRILGGLVVAGLALIVTQWRADSKHPKSAPSLRHRRRTWLWILANSLAGPVLGVSCYQGALQSTPTGIVLPIVATTPLVVIPLAHWIEGERATRQSLFGGVVAVVGAIGLALKL